MSENAVNQLVNATEGLFEYSASDLANLSAILASDDFANLSFIFASDDLTAIPDPISALSALSAYFSSPEFALLEREVAGSGMQEFDDRVRRGLDPTTSSEQGIIDKFLTGTIAILDTVTCGLARLRSMLVSYSRSVQDPGNSRVHL
ncbi:hypothetical protein BC937DRAFT_87532 [Endogone sp. FLAS-F59071]|nr:hypothetical protein BC937DRAFT_87532 [Endogone sp. FLAS-F59071]|eukprot:RUS12556.1 hypothetical protein BC937DRAFT_87532 [Endogone sp. FLAS-F59071]